MPTTPDRHPGPALEEELQLEPQGTDPDVAGALRYVGGAFRLKDASGVFNPRTGGSGISEAQHLALDTLVHELDETSYLEVTRSGGQVTDVIVWTNSGKTLKVREMNVTRSGGLIATVVEKQYNGAGTLVETLTYTIARSGAHVASIDVVRT